MKNRAYWEKRVEYISNLQFDKSDSYILNLDEEYEKDLESIQREIELVYKKYDIGSMPYSAKIARLKILKAQIESKLYFLFEKQEKDLTNLLYEIYKDTYHRNIFELYKGLGIAVNFIKINDKAIEKTIKEPWYGLNYSKRVWRDRKALTKELQTALMQSFIRGDSIDKTSKIIANKMNVGKGVARRLVNTESAYITSKATLQGYTNSGVVKRYQILATLDIKTSDRCRRMDSKDFSLEEWEVAVTAPPFHANCRTTTIPYFEDDIDVERIARDSNGNSYYVAGNMKYEEWYKEHVL